MAKSESANVTKPTHPFVRVAAYGRVSTVNQLLANDNSIDTQLSLIRKQVELETAKAATRPGGRPWKIVDEYREEGRSGKDNDRPELKRMLADIRAGQIDVVVVTKIDRITRSLLGFYELWDAFEKAGVEFVALGDALETTTTTGRTMLKLTLIFAEMERERTSERTKAKIDSRRRDGLWFGGPIPFGYAPHPTDKTTLQVDQEAARILREEIFLKYLEMDSARALTRHLARLGIKRPVRKNGRGEECGGGAFTTQALLGMLESRIYVGQRKLETGEVIQCSWQPLIEEAVFERVQVRLKANSVDRPSGRVCGGHVYKLEGRLRCGHCGAMMTRASAKGANEETYFYYRCANRHRTAGTGCTVRDIPVNAVERLVIDQVKQYALNPTAIVRAVQEANTGRDAELARVDADLKRARSAYATASKLVESLLDAVERDAVEGQGTNGPGLRARYREREVAKDRLKSEVDELSAARDQLRHKMLDAQAVQEGLRDLPGVLERAERAGKQEQVRELLHALLGFVEWREDAPGGKRGTASLRLHHVPSFWRVHQGPEREQPGDALMNSVSPGCPEQLPRHDSNMRPGD
jgi:site-specific DNA recombinase